MKKLLKRTAIIAGLLLIILIIGILALPFIFPLEKIKDLATAKISEAIHREVKIEKVSFDLFSGIKLKGLFVGNRTGFAQKPFILADAIELRYAFWPLFSRQIIIKEIRLVRPEILIEKNARGEFNFSDLLQPREKSSSKPRESEIDTSLATKKQKTKPPFDLFISSFSIKDGKITYVDYLTKTTNEIKNLNVKISGFELALVKPIDIKASASLTYQGKETPVSLSGRIGVSMAQESITVPNLSLSIAGESVTASAAISDWKEAPKIVLSLNSKKINLDPLLAIFAAPAKVEKPKPRPGELTKTINTLTALIPRNLSVNGKVNIENLTFQKFKVDRLNAEIFLANKFAKVTLKEVRIYDGILSGSFTVDLNSPGLAYEAKDLHLVGFNAAPFSNSVIETFLTNLPDYRDNLNKLFGILNISASLKGHGVEPQDIFGNLIAEGSMALKKGELKRIKTLAEIGKMLKSNTLQENIKFGELEAAFGLKNRVVEVKSLKLDRSDFKLHFKGGIDLNNLIWVPGNRLTLKLSPETTKDLPKEFSIFRDEKGWVELTFEITGKLKMPIPKPIFEKPVEAAIGKIKAKIEAKKIEIEEKAKAELATRETEVKKAIEEKIEAEKKRLEEEAKGKLKELIKF